jgi:hypothetical protein
MADLFESEETENVEDQIDRLNHLLKDVMQNFDDELQARNTIPVQCEYENDPMQIDLISESGGLNDNYTEFNLSEIIREEE